MPCRAPAFFHDNGSASGCQVHVQGQVHNVVGKVQRIGTWYWRNAKGQVLREVNYDSDGREHGMTRLWKVPGRNVDDIQENLVQARRYFHGRWHGVTELWTAGGKPDGSRCFVCGERSKMEECRFDTSSEREFAKRCTPAVPDRSVASHKKSGSRVPASIR